jgi:hypothetical protein
MTNLILVCVCVCVCAVIVGVGNDDFKEMETLDGDGRLLQARSGKKASRDIVQFVPFQQFRNQHYSELARVTLAGLSAAFPPTTFLLRLACDSPHLNNP